VGRVDRVIHGSVLSAHASPLGPALPRTYADLPGAADPLQLGEPADGEAYVSADPLSNPEAASLADAVRADQLRGSSE